MVNYIKTVLKIRRKVFEESFGKARDVSLMPVELRLFTELGLKKKTL